jgi:hypothetical protein
MESKLVTARKDHRCTFCRRKIYKGRQYSRATVAPWDHPDNDGFFEMKAHPICERIFYMVASDYDNLFPEGKQEFREMVSLARSYRKKARMAQAGEVPRPQKAQEVE